MKMEFSRRSSLRNSGRGSGTLSVRAPLFFPGTAEATPRLTAPKVSPAASTTEFSRRSSPAKLGARFGSSSRPRPAFFHRDGTRDGTSDDTADGMAGAARTVRDSAPLAGFPTKVDPVAEWRHVAERFLGFISSLRPLSDEHQKAHESVALVIANLRTPFSRCRFSPRIQAVGGKHRSRRRPYVGGESRQGYSHPARPGRRRDLHTKPRNSSKNRQRPGPHARARFRLGRAVFPGSIGPTRGGSR